MLTLVGLITKHGILMVEFANELQLKEGLDKRSAIEMAARIRLRPILMTTAAMVTGLMPLLTATRRGRREPVLDRPRGGRRHVDRHAVHAVRAAGGLRVRWRPTTAPGADSERTKEIAEFDLGKPALKPT